MRPALPIVALAAVLVTLLGPAKAAAQDPNQLFKEGLDEMLAGNFASGCPKIERAYEATKGAGGLFTLAECHAKWGQPKTALKHYRAYLALFATLDPAQRAAQQERADLASGQVTALAALVPSLDVLLPPDAQDAAVTIDGAPVTLTGPVTLEVGTHRVTVVAADGRRADRDVALQSGQRETWRVQLVGAPIPDPDRIETPSDGLSNAQIAGLVIGGVGVASVVVGAVTGGLALSKKSTVDERCDGIDCDAEGLDAAQSGKTLGDVSTATFVIGGAAIAAGVVLVVLFGDDEPTQTGLSVTPNGLAWRF